MGLHASSCSELVHVMSWEGMAIGGDAQLSSREGCEWKKAVAQWAAVPWLETKEAENSVMNIKILDGISISS